MCSVYHWFSFRIFSARILHACISIMVLVPHGSLLSALSSPSRYHISLIRYRRGRGAIPLPTAMLCDDQRASERLPHYGRRPKAPYQGPPSSRAARYDPRTTHSSLMAAVAKETDFCPLPPSHHCLSPAHAHYSRGLLQGAGTSPLRQPRRLGRVAARDAAHSGVPVKKRRKI